MHATPQESDGDHEELALVLAMLGEAEADMAKMASVFNSLVAQLAGNDMEERQALMTPPSTRLSKDPCQGPPIRNLHCLQRSVEVLI